MVESDENAANRLRIVIDWPALDVDREKQIIEEPWHPKLSCA